MKRIFVTGASKGLGAAIAERLSAKGNIVVGTSRKAVSPDGVAKKGVTMVPLDVCSEVSVDALATWLLDQNFLPDVVILNAGNGLSGAIESSCLEDARAQFETNFFGVHRVIRAVLPQMRERGSGHLIFIGSIGGLISIPFQGLYSASKFAIEGYAEALRMEVKVHGVEVSIIEPGDYNTSFGDGQIVPSLSAGPAYEPQASRAIAKMRESERKGSDPRKLARLVEKVIRSPKPRLRYASGTAFEKVGIVLKRLLPAQWFERIMMSEYQVPSKK